MGVALLLTLQNPVMLMSVFHQEDIDMALQLPLRVLIVLHTATQYCSSQKGKFR